MRSEPKIPRSASCKWSWFGGVLLSPVLRETQGMTTPIDWIGILSFACCGVLLGEIFGSYFSVLHPEPIERSSLYSGGTTPGAFLVPVLQTVILAVLIVPGASARRNLGDVPAGILFVSVPVVLLVAEKRRTSLMGTEEDDQGTGVHSSQADGNLKIMTAAVLSPGPGRGTTARRRRSRA